MTTLWKFKKTLPYFQHDQRILVGDRLIGIKDPQGTIARLLNLADGTRTTEELARALSNDQIQVSTEDVETVSHQLMELGLFEDVSFHHPQVLAPDLRDRLRVNINFFSHRTLNQDPYLLQERVRAARVTLLGLGGGGSNLLMHIAGLGVQDIIGVDYDCVELSNLNRQPLYTPDDIGSLKAEAAAQWMNRFYPESHFQPVAHKISSTRDAIEVMRGRDLVIVAADEPVVAMRQWVNEAAVETGVPFIVGGIRSLEAHYEMFKVGETPCWECVQTHNRQKHPQWETLVSVVSQSHYRSQSVILPHMGILTSLIAADALNYLAGLSQPWAWGKRVQFNFSDGTLSVYDEWVRDPHCPVCHPTHGVSAHVG
jgi:molybdopterin/thiamine biosynthesis adenylyltransferase